MPEGKPRLQGEQGKLGEPTLESPRWKAEECITIMKVCRDVVWDHWQQTWRDS